MAIRLNKLLSVLKLASRREADRLIAQGLVAVRCPERSKFITAMIADRVDPNLTAEDIQIVGKEVSDVHDTIVLHKPIGYVSSQPERNDEGEYSYLPAIQLLCEDNFEGNRSNGKHGLLKDDLLNPRYQQSGFKGWAPVGRLDVDSTGLLIFSKDGTVVKSIIDGTSAVEKEYKVKVNKKEMPADLTKIFDQTGGRKLFLKGDRRPLKPIPKVEWIVENEVIRIILREGRKRQVRRMVEDILKRKCRALKRISVGPVNLGALSVGGWRYITKHELEQLKEGGEVNFE